jgi:site-specific DNA-methyltransferase (adenine-specific)
MKNMPLPRLDENRQLHDHLLRYCRIKEGQVWDDPQGRHRVGCLDSADLAHIKELMDGEKATPTLFIAR